MTRDDQANINSFGRLNNRLHELDAELEGKKACADAQQRRPCAVPDAACCHVARAQKLLDDLEDASNELMITDDTEVRARARCLASRGLRVH